MEGWNYMRAKSRMGGAREVEKIVEKGVGKVRFLGGWHWQYWGYGIWHGWRDYRPKKGGLLHSIDYGYRPDKGACYRINQISDYPCRQVE